MIFEQLSVLRGDRRVLALFVSLNYANFVCFIGKKICWVYPWGLRQRWFWDKLKILTCVVLVLGLFVLLGHTNTVYMIRELFPFMLLSLSLLVLLILHFL